jgi:hypothetical protein
MYFFITFTKLSLIAFFLNLYKTLGQVIYALENIKYRNYSFAWIIL